MRLPQRVLRAAVGDVHAQARQQARAGHRRARGGVGAVRDHSRQRLARQPDRLQRDAVADGGAHLAPPSPRSPGRGRRCLCRRSVSVAGRGSATGSTSACWARSSGLAMPALMWVASSVITAPPETSLAGARGGGHADQRELRRLVGGLAPGEAHVRPALAGHQPCAPWRCPWPTRRRSRPPRRSPLRPAPARLARPDRPSARPAPSRSGGARHGPSASATLGTIPARPSSITIRRSARPLVGQHAGQVCGGALAEADLHRKVVSERAIALSWVPPSGSTSSPTRTLPAPRRRRTPRSRLLPRLSRGPVDPAQRVCVALAGLGVRVS